MEGDNMEHTPEPWVAEDKTRWQEATVGHCIRMQGKNGQPGPVVAVILSGKHFGKTRAQADTARIVACFNACKGINPDAIPVMLEALERLLRVMTWAHLTELGKEAVAQAETAIAKAKG